MTRWTSRIITIVMLGLLLAAGSSAFDRHRLAWLENTPTDQIVEHYRRVYSHSFIGDAIMIIVMLGILFVLIEGTSWCLCRSIGAAATTVDPAD
jgi:hypothetical protein